MPGVEQFRFEDAGPDELDTVRAILVAASEPYRESLPPEAFACYLAMVLDLESRLGTSELILVTEKEQPIATATFFPDAGAEGWDWPDGFAGLRAMGVHPAAQRRGVGAALVGECVRRARTIEARAIGLHTASFLQPAVRLYQGVGFTRDPTHDHGVADLIGLNDSSWDATAMAYRLDLA